MQQPKSVTIIGAGITGLSLGCYLQMNGYNTVIYESHSLPGGLCTCWNRGGYTFNGAIHWLLGSKKGNAFHKIWSELIDVDTIPMVHHDIRVEFDVLKNYDKYGRQTFFLYNSLDKLESYFLDIAPEDSKVIAEFINAIRFLQKYNDIPPVFYDENWFKALMYKMKLARLLPLYFFMKKWEKQSNISFAQKISNPFLREAFELLFDGQEVKLPILLFPQAYFDKQLAGYPVGGSLALSQKIEERFIALGGTILYNSPVSKILVENNTAIGVELQNESKHLSDYVVSAADWKFTVYDALEGKYINESITKLRNEETYKVFYSVFMVSIGIDIELNSIPHFFRFPVSDKIISPDGSEHDRLELHVYNYDETLAPKGKTSMTISFYTANGNYWIDLRNKDIQEYRKQKKEFADTIIALACKRVPELNNHIEIVDIATPATYFRYTNNWKGSSQGWMPISELMASSKIEDTLPGLHNFYFSGHWTIPGGGLPIAIKSARDVVWKICKKDGKRFKHSIT